MPKCSNNTAIFCEEPYMFLVQKEVSKCSCFKISWSSLSYIGRIRAILPSLYILHHHTTLLKKQRRDSRPPHTLAGIREVARLGMELVIQPWLIFWTKSMLILERPNNILQWFGFRWRLSCRTYHHQSFASHFIFYPTAINKPLFSFSNS